MKIPSNHELADAFNALAAQKQVALNQRGEWLRKDGTHYEGSDPDMDSTYINLRDAQQFYTDVAAEARLGRLVITPEPK